MRGGRTRGCRKSDAEHRDLLAGSGDLRGANLTTMGKDQYDVALAGRTWLVLTAGIAIATTTGLTSLDHRPDGSLDMPRIRGR